MMTPSHKLTLAASLALAAALTFSCSGDGGGEPPTGTSSENTASSSSDASSSGGSSSSVSSSSVVSSSSSEVSSSSSIDCTGSWGEWLYITSPIGCAEGEKARICKTDPSQVERVAIPAPVDYNKETQFCDSRDGRLYKLAVIGTGTTAQTWMAENLNYDVPGNDTDVCYDNDPTNCITYGRLYNGATAMDGVCPEGWHLPSKGEWEKLINFVSSEQGSANAGRYLAATSWNSGFDTYGFAALGGGINNQGGFFASLDSYGLWHTSTSNSSVTIGSGNYLYFEQYYSEGLSVRCVKD